LVDRRARDPADRTASGAKSESGSPAGRWTLIERCRHAGAGKACGPGGGRAEGGRGSKARRRELQRRSARRTGPKPPAPPKAPAAVCRRPNRQAPR
ncbi:hypothetical protein BLX88_26180, partial [Bacillus obstructivus]